MISETQRYLLIAVSVLFLGMLAAPYLVRAKAYRYFMARSRWVVILPYSIFLGMQILLVFLDFQSPVQLVPWTQPFKIAVIIWGVLWLAAVIFSWQAERMFAVPEVQQLLHWGNAIVFVSAGILAGISRPGGALLNYAWALTWGMLCTAVYQLLFVALVWIKFTNTENEGLGVWYRYHTRNLFVRKAYGACLEAAKLILSVNGLSDEFEGSFNCLVGVCYFRKKEYPSAIEYYSRSIQVAPTYGASLSDNRFNLGVAERAIAYVNRAEAFTEEGRYEEAIRDCESALEIDPSDTHAKNMILELSPLVGRK